MSHVINNAPYKDVNDITFNRFFASMAMFLPPLGEGWYRITDFQTSGYILDRYYFDNFGQYRTYGPGGMPNLEHRTEIEPLIVYVSIKRTDLGGGRIAEWNVHDHRVYSEVYPHDEIYWTWDWGFEYLWADSQGIPRPPKNQILYGDASIFGFDSTNWYGPIHKYEPYNTPEVPIANPAPGGVGGWDANLLSDPAGQYFQYWRGFIYKRTDTIRNITADFDWREVVLARYSSQGVYDPYDGNAVYTPGQVTLGNDGWLYLCVSGTQRNDPTLYDSYNDIFAQDIFGNSIFVWGDYRLARLAAPPTNAFAPTSMRRAWIRLWPESYHWFSPWVIPPDKGDFWGSAGNLNLRYMDGVSNSLKNSIAQPLNYSLSIDPSTFIACKCISGDGDQITGVSLPNYIDSRQWELNRFSDIDLGGKSYVYKSVCPQPGEAGPVPGLFSDRSPQRYIDNLEFEIDDEVDLNPTPNPDTVDPSNLYGWSRISDNRIVADFGDNDWNPYDGDRSPWQGEVRNIKFGPGSVGNTIFAWPYGGPDERRANWYRQQVAVIDQTVTGLLSSFKRNEIQHLSHGFGWYNRQLITSGTELGVEPLEWPTLTPSILYSRYGEPLPNIHELAQVPRYLFGDIDFGNEAMGNVSFCSFTWTTASQPLTYPYIDNAYLSVAMDGAFAQTKFKNSNRFNFFLHGISGCEIDSSIGNIFEGLYKVNIKNADHNVLRDMYWCNLDDSRYNSICHAIHLNQTGVAARNYLDNIVGTTIKDQFWFNSWKLGDIPGRRYADLAEWTNTAYAQHWNNEIEEGAILNRVQGFSQFNRFGRGFSKNVPETGRDQMNIVGCEFGAGFMQNQFPGRGNIMYRVTSEPWSTFGLNFGPSVLLVQDWPKYIRSSMIPVGGANWAQNVFPWLEFYDESIPDFIRLQYGAMPFPNF